MSRRDDSIVLYVMYGVHGRPSSSADAQTLLGMQCTKVRVQMCRHRRMNWISGLQIALPLGNRSQRKLSFIGSLASASLTGSFANRRGRHTLLCSQRGSGIWGPSN